MGSKLKAIEKNDIVSKVYEQMKAEIVNGNWKPGQKLPSEHELCEILNVSRISVRSAVQKLRDNGLITTKHGKGSFVSENIQNVNIEFMAPIMTMSKKDFMDVMEFRESIELKCMELIAHRADAEDIAAIEQALQEMIASKDDYAKYTKADFNFHYAIVKASKNRLFIKFMEDIKDIYYYHLEELNRVFGGIEESLQGHIRQFETIKSRDIEAIKKLIRESIDSTIERTMRQLERQEKA